MPMIDASGTVVSLDGDQAVVLMDATGCGRCHEEGGCGGLNIAQALCGSPRTFRIANPLGAGVGDRVSFATAEGVVSRGAMLAYGMPLVALFLGAIGGLLVSGETGAIVGAVVGLFVAWLILRYFLSDGKAGQDFSPNIKY